MGIFNAKKTSDEMGFWPTWALPAPSNLGAKPEQLVYKSSARGRDFTVKSRKKAAKSKVSA